MFEAKKNAFSLRKESKLVARFTNANDTQARAIVHVKLKHFNISTSKVSNWFRVSFLESFGKGSLEIFVVLVSGRSE